MRRFSPATDATNATSAFSATYSGRGTPYTHFITAATNHPIYYLLLSLLLIIVSKNNKIRK